MKQISLLVLMFMISACEIEVGDPPYPWPRHAEDSERLGLSTPGNQIQNYFTTDPVQRLRISVKKDELIVGEQEWITYDLPQSGWAPDYTVLLVVENDSLRRLTRKAKRWYDGIISDTDYTTEILEKRKSKWESEGMSVEVSVL